MNRAHRNYCQHCNEKIVCRNDRWYHIALIGCLNSWECPKNGGWPHEPRSYTS